MVLPVYLLGHPILRKVSEEIDQSYPELEQLIENMKETMYASDGVGIAAPQVGLNIRLIYIDADVVSEDFPECKGVKMVLINPELTIDEESKTVSREEGCLSLPGIHENVTRHTRVHLKWIDENWVSHEQDFEGFTARIIQHEYDHLEGHVFTDRISPIRKQLIRNKLNNIVKGKVSCSYRTKSYKPSRR